MDLNFSDNYFQLFGLIQGMALDEDVLDERYKLLQLKSHPDRYVNGSDAERRWSMQATSLINQARQVLIDPLSRATYLLSLEGIDLDSETDTRMSGEFLMAQIELREGLAVIRSKADPFAELDKLSSQVNAETRLVQSKFENALLAKDLDLARSGAREWQFLYKLKHEINEFESLLEDE